MSDRARNSRDVVCCGSDACQRDRGLGRAEEHAREGDYREHEGGGVWSDET